MALLLLECKQDDERQADLCVKEASSLILEMMTSFAHGSILL